MTSIAAQQFRQALDLELAQNASAAGTTAAFSAAEEKILGLISEQIDRREALVALYDAAETTTSIIALCAEIRLADAAITRMAKQVSTSLPAPKSITSIKASKAANARWTRARMAGQA